MTELVALKEEEYALLSDFMKDVWLNTYKEIIGERQALFLHGKYFEESAVKEFVSKGYNYYFITYNGERAGLLVFTEGEEVYLDKLYVLNAFRKKGLASYAFEFLKSKNKRISLNVNRANEVAVKVYLKNGFKVVEEQEILLDGGMVNYDYKMSL